MTNDSLTETDAVKALTRSVNAMDASRRVGWAKSYEAADREEQAQRDLNVLRGDLAILSKFAAYSAGVIQGLGVDVLLQPEYEQVASYLPDAPRHAGEFRARQWLKDNGKMKSVKKRTQELKKENSSLREDIREHQREILMWRYDFPDEETMLDWLSKYATT